MVEPLLPTYHGAIVYEPVPPYYRRPDTLRWPPTPAKPAQPEPSLSGQGRYYWVRVKLAEIPRGVLPHFRRYQRESPSASDDLAHHLVSPLEIDFQGVKVYQEVSLAYQRLPGVHCYLDLYEGEALDLELEECQETGHTILCAHVHATESGLNLDFHHPRLQLQLEESGFFMMSEYNLRPRDLP